VVKKIIKMRNEKGQFIRGSSPIASPFKKGMTPWNKGKTGHLSDKILDKMRISHLGKKLSQEQKEKIGLSSRGHITSEETRKKIGDANRNKVFTMGHRKKLSLAHRGKKFTEQHRKKISDSNKGKVMSKEAVRKIILAQKGKPRLNIRGERHYNWQGGLTSLNAKIRNSLEYKLWRDAVFARDNWTCVWCGQHGGQLHVDHIKPFSLFPELRFAIDNGRTLCVDCHQKTDSYAGKILKNY